MAHSQTENGMDPAAADCSALTADGHFLIRIVRSGIGCLKIGGEFYLLRPGTAFIIRPGETKSCIWLTESAVLDFLLTTETAALMRANAPAFLDQDVRIVSEEILERLEQLAGECQEEQKQQRPGSQLAVLEKQLAAERLIFQEGSAPAKTEGKIAGSLVFITENYVRDVTLHDLAEQQGMSISYYRRLFRQLLGGSPIDCLLDYRLFQAGKRLAGSADPIAGIAAECGFNDPNYFSRLFTRRKGMTPRQWRQSFRKS